MLDLAGKSWHRQTLADAEFEASILAPLVRAFA